MKLGEKAFNAKYAHEQLKNLEYVSITRAKSYLGYISFED